MKKTSSFKVKNVKALEKLLKKQKKKTFSQTIQSKSKTGFKSKIKSDKLDSKFISNNLADKCRKTLDYSRFRGINEFIYEHSSDQGFNYMKNEDTFKKYHQAYEQIASKWPVKPVDFIADKIERLEGPDWCREVSIADLGCGRVPILKQKLTKAKVYSFDVVSEHEDVISANITKVPLKNHLCHYTVFSLSLMATNLKDLILEANRILKRKGILLIAEVTSRFEEVKIEGFEEKMKSFGFDLAEKEYLPPNKFFVLFVFIKRKDIIKKANVILPDINLKACLYKPR